MLLHFKKTTSEMSLCRPRVYSVRFEEDATVTECYWHVTQFKSALESALYVNIINCVLYYNHNSWRTWRFLRW